MNERNERRVTAGTYRGRCTGSQDVKFGESSEGTLQIGLLFEVTAGECKGQRAIWYGSLSTDAAKEFTREVLLACGWDGRSWTELSGLSKNCVKLVFEEDGRYVKLRYVNPDTKVSFKRELSPDEARARLEALGLSDRRPPSSTATDQEFPEEAAAEGGF